MMLRAATASLTLSLLALGAACGSDDKKSSSTTDAPAGAADESPEEPETVDTTPPTETTTLDSAAPTDNIATTESVETTTDITDGPDVIDDSVLDTFVDETDLPPVPTGSDVTTQLCETLVTIHDWFTAFDSMDEDNTSWEELQEFDREETPFVLDAYAELAGQVPELDEASGRAAAFTERLSEIIQSVDSYEEGSAVLEDEDDFDELMEQGLALEAINDYAEQECVLADDDADDSAVSST
jgi:hypothetical protein